MKEIVREDVMQIKKLLEQVLGTGDYQQLSRMGGLTNHTYHVTMKDGREYAVRLPGEGTEEMIQRSDEKISTELACELGVDAQLLYFGDKGEKVTEYIPNAVTMSAEALHKEKHIRQMAEILQTIHKSGRDTGVPFEVFDMAAEYESLLESLKVPMYADYPEYKAKVMALKQQIDTEIHAPKVPCHNDPLCENWVEGDGRMYLIDWEYAGMNDGMWDLADVSLEAEFDEEHDMKFLAAYLGKTPDTKEIKHFRASKVYVDYLWTMWAKARVPYDGQPMEDWARERYDRMKANLLAFETREGTL